MLRRKELKTYQKPPVQEEPQREIKKAFSFVNLGVDTTPEQLMESDKSFLYMQSMPGYNVPNAMITTNNIYDELISNTNGHMAVYHRLSEVYPDQPISEREFQISIKDLVSAYMGKIASAIVQNVLIVYQNGLGDILNRFADPTKTISNITFNPVFDLTPTVSYIHLFSVRPEKSDYHIDDYCSDNEILTNPKSNDAIINMTSALRCILRRVTENYNNIINNTMNTPGYFDQEAFAKYVMGSDNVPFDIVPPTSYNGICFAALNETASNDLAKIAELIEICIVQGSTEFYNDLHVHGFLTE